MSRDRFLIIASISVGTTLLACMLSSAYAVLIDPLPFPQSNRIVAVSTFRHGSRLASSFPDYDDLSEESGPFSNSIYVRTVGDSTEVNGHPESMLSMSFHGNLFSVFQSPPVLGELHALDSNRHQDSPVAILTYAAWIRFFGRDPRVLGKVVHTGRSAYEIQAVLPPEYQFVLPADIWVTSYKNAGRRDSRDGRIFARLPDRASVASANAYLETMATVLQRRAPGTNEGIIFKSALLRDSLAGKSKLLLYLLGLGAAIVLCVGYFNVYQLLTARAAAASARWHICVALGATRRRLFRDILKEPMLLCLTGCIAGLALSVLSMHTLRALSPPDIPRIADTRLVWEVVLASFAISILAAGLFAALMLRKIAFGAAGTLNENIRRGESIRNAFHPRRQSLLIVQIALSTTLLISIGMVATALYKATAADLGFSAEGISITDLFLKEATGTSAGSAYVRQIIQSISTLPGVESVAAASKAPFQKRSYTTTFTVKGQEHGKELQYVAVSPEFFQTLQTRMLRGRAFTKTDNSTSPAVAVLNQSAARNLFGGSDCLDRRLKAGLSNSQSTIQVVGVVEDIRQDPTTVIAPPVVYLPLSQAAVYSISLVVRAKAPVGNTEIKARIWQLNANQAVQETEALADLINASLRRIRYTAFLMALYAGVTMLLSATGIYAAVAQWLSSSRKEIALYLALGATYSQIRRSILIRVMTITGSALAIGMILAFGAGSAIQSLLYGVHPQLSAILVLATLLLALVALLSSYVPSLRARFIDPAELLRSE